MASSHTYVLCCFVCIPYIPLGLLCIPYMPLCMRVSVPTYSPMVACSCSHLLACSIWSFSSPAHSSTCHPFSCHALLHNCPAPPLFNIWCPPPSYTVSPSQVFFVSLSDMLLHLFIFLPLLLQPAILSCLLTLLPTLIYFLTFSVLF